MPRPLKSDFAERIRAMVDLYETRKEAMAAADVSRPQLDRYMRGASKISLNVAARLAGPVGISLDWLASGAGRQFLDNEAGDRAQQKSLVTDQIDRFLTDGKLTLSRARKWDLARGILNSKPDQEGTSTDEVDLEPYLDFIRAAARRKR